MEIYISNTGMAVCMMAVGMVIGAMPFLLYTAFKSGRGK